MAVESDLQRHQQDWKNFIRLVAYTLGAIVVILALLAIFVV